MNMARRVVVTIGLLAVSSGILIGAPIQAQVPSAPQSCFSPPVENTKLFVNVNGKLQTSHGNRDTSRKVIVDRIEFDRPVHLSNSDIEQVIEKANKSEWDADSPSWIDAFAEI